MRMVRLSIDVVVVGGGINGVSIAFHLAKHGARAVLLEKGFIAGGPTGRSSAIIRQHYSNAVTAKMALKSLRIWQNFSDVVGGDAGYIQTGIMIGVRPQDVEGLKANISLQRSVGIDTNFVPPEVINELEPHLDTAGLGGAAYEPEGGYCDPAMAANSFAHAAKELGVEIRSGVTVRSLRLQGGKIIGVETDQGFHSAESVVVAAGPWSVQLLEPIGIDVPIITARVKVGIYRRPTHFARHQIWTDFITQVYLRPETGNLTLVGTISPQEETGDLVTDPDNFNESVGLDILSKFSERAASRYPALQSSHLVSSYASLYDVTPDWHPILDVVPGIGGLYLCAGSSGHGFKLAPAVGEMMTRLVLQGKEPEDDINLFSFDRFASGNLVRGQYDYSILG